MWKVRGGNICRKKILWFRALAVIWFWLFLSQKYDRVYFAKTSTIFSFKEWKAKKSEHFCLSTIFFLLLKQPIHPLPFNDQPVWHKPCYAYIFRLFWVTNFPCLQRVLKGSFPVDKAVTVNIRDFPIHTATRWSLFFLPACFEQMFI